MVIGIQINGPVMHPINCKRLCMGDVQNRPIRPHVQYILRMVADCYQNYSFFVQQ